MRGERPEALLRGYFAWEPKTDKLDFQWRARLLQSAWRHRRGFAVGQNLGKRRGACLQRRHSTVCGEYTLCPILGGAD